MKKKLILLSVSVVLFVACSSANHKSIEQEHIKVLKKWNQQLECFQKTLEKIEKENIPDINKLKTIPVCCFGIEKTLDDTFKEEINGDTRKKIWDKIKNDYAAQIPYPKMLTSTKIPAQIRALLKKEHEIFVKKIIPTHKSLLKNLTN